MDEAKPRATLTHREAIGGVLEGAGSLDNTSSPFAQALTDVLEPDVQRAYRIERNVFLTQMASGGSLEEAQAAVRVLEQRSPIWTTGALQRFDGIVKDRMPGGLDVLEQSFAAFCQLFSFISAAARLP